MYIFHAYTEFHNSLRQATSIHIVHTHNDLRPKQIRLIFVPELTVSISDISSCAVTVKLVRACQLVSVKHTIHVIIPPVVYYKNSRANFNTKMMIPVQSEISSEFRETRSVRMYYLQRIKFDGFGFLTERI